MWIWRNLEVTWILIHCGIKFTNQMYMVVTPKRNQSGIHSIVPIGKRCYNIRIKLRNVFSSIVLCWVPEPCLIDWDGVVTPCFLLVLHKFALVTLMISYNLSIRELVPQIFDATNFHTLRASLFHFIADCVGDHNFFRNPRAIIIKKHLRK